MKVLVYGLAGIVVACLIFAGIFVPRSELTKFFSTNVSPEIPTNPIVDNSSLAVELTISNFTEPLGPDSEANVTIGITSRKILSNVTLQIRVSPFYVGQGDWPNVTWVPVGPQAIDLIGGNVSLTVNIPADSKMSFNARTKATRVGSAVIIATATWWESGVLHTSEGALWIAVLKDAINVSNGSESFMIP